jgi:ribosomal-protein-alanine N-acetyltransferase
MIEAVALAPAGPGDATAIARMTRLWIETGLPPRWSRDAHLRCIQDPDTEIVLARSRSAVVGFANMEFHFEQCRAHLLLLAVDPRLRRGGLGRALFDYLHVMARRGGIDRIQLEVRVSNPAAQQFYEALGFRTIERLPLYYAEREDALRMALELA